MNKKMENLIALIRSAFNIDDEIIEKSGFVLSDDKRFKSFVNVVFANDDERDIFYLSIIGALSIIYDLEKEISIIKEIKDTQKVLIKNLESIIERQDQRIDELKNRK